MLHWASNATSPPSPHPRRRLQAPCPPPEVPRTVAFATGGAAVPMPPPLVPGQPLSTPQAAAAAPAHAHGRVPSAAEPPPYNPDDWMPPSGWKPPAMTAAPPLISAPAADAVAAKPAVDGYDGADASAASLAMGKPSRGAGGDPSDDRFCHIFVQNIKAGVNSLEVCAYFSRWVHGCWMDGLAGWAAPRPAPLERARHTGHRQCRLPLTKGSLASSPGTLLSGGLLLLLLSGLASWWTVPQCPRSTSPSCTLRSLPAGTPRWRRSTASRCVGGGGGGGGGPQSPWDAQPPLRFCCHRDRNQCCLPSPPPHPSQPTAGPWPVR